MAVLEAATAVISAYSAGFNPAAPTAYLPMAMFDASMAIMAVLEAATAVMAVLEAATAVMAVLEAATAVISA